MIKHEQKMVVYNDKRDDIIVHTVYTVYSIQYTVYIPIYKSKSHSFISFFGMNLTREKENFIFTYKQHTHTVKNFALYIKEEKYIS